MCMMVHVDCMYNKYGGLISNTIPFTEFEYLHAVKKYGNLNFQKKIPNL